MWRTHDIPTAALGTRSLESSLTFTSRPSVIASSLGAILVRPFVRFLPRATSPARSRSWTQFLLTFSSLPLPMSLHPRCPTSFGMQPIARKHPPVNASISVSPHHGPRTLAARTYAAWARSHSPRRTRQWPLKRYARARAWCAWDARAVARASSAWPRARKWMSRRVRSGVTSPGGSCSIAWQRRRVALTDAVMVALSVRARCGGSHGRGVWLGSFMVGGIVL